MSAVDPSQLIESSGAIRTGHFVLDSGLHSTRYFQAVDLLASVEASRLLCSAMAASWRDHGIAGVVGANEAGSVLAFCVAAELGCEPHFARRNRGGYDLIGGRPLPGGPVLVVDDITTTGSTAAKLLAAVDRAGGQAVGVAVLATKGLFAIDLGVETTVLVQLAGMDAVAADDCAACAAQEPLSA